MKTYYTDQHEWISLEGDTATVGITAHAAKQLGEVVYLELPEDGAKVAQGDSFAIVESSKTASDVYAPASGTVLEVNAPLVTEMERINADPEKDAWLVRMKIDNPAELEKLMDKAAYDAFCEGH
ncbi:glycine cleavage system protein GcvH [Hyphomonas sp.]|uniref:glycine cleavage system protein GcvH n=1 Tax=Hyphomonas sp. TaxID=87 RepID=UPI0039197000